jgi:hypothetical protein
MNNLLQFAQTAAPRIGRMLQAVAKAPSGITTLLPGLIPAEGRRIGRLAD